LLRLTSFQPVQDLYEAAALAASAYSGTGSEQLNKALDTVRKLIELRNTVTAQIVINKARDLHINSECDIDVDDGTMVYHNETDGWWVMGWLWVSELDLPDADARKEGEDWFAATVVCQRCGNEEKEDGLWGCDNISLAHWRCCSVCGSNELLQKS